MHYHMFYILLLMYKIGAALPLLVSIWFQVYFTALSGLLFTFPSRY
jgi:hypothetical protein